MSHSYQCEITTNWGRGCWGKIDEFNVEKESFDNYVERMEQFFEANAIAVDKRKPVFLAACGAKTYETLKTLCLPKYVEYKDIIKLLETHLSRSRC